MRQDPEGFFNPCTVQVHNITGAAVMTTMHKQLPHLEPGFMVPLPRFMCLSLDWLFVGWNARCHKAIAEEDSGFVDEDGLFTEDKERKLLHSLTVSQSVFARSLCFNTCVESMEICGEEWPVLNMDQERLGNFICN